MNEDKDNLMREEYIELHNSGEFYYNALELNDPRRQADYWLNKMQESNKALLTKLREEIEIERIHKPELIPTNPDYYESEEYFRHEVKRDENNRILDINIALIDKYLE